MKNFIKLIELVNYISIKVEDFDSVYLVINNKLEKFDIKDFNKKNNDLSIYKGLKINNIFYDTRKLDDFYKKDDKKKYNKQEVKNNFLNGFIFIKGNNFNPYEKLDSIIHKNIDLLFVENEYLELVLNYLEKKDLLQKKGRLIIITAKNNRMLLPWIVKFQNNFLDEKFYICGVTGTNGKTTTVNLLMEFYNNLNDLSASIGTIGINYKNNKFEKNTISIERTTPEIYDLFNYFHILKDENIKNIFIEVSSIGAVLGRVDSIAFDSIIFTNMTEDHLDFHGSLENYYNSKLKYINLLQKSPKKNKLLIFNIDDKNSTLIIDKIESIKKNEKKIDFDIIVYGKDIEKKEFKNLNIFIKKNIVIKGVTDIKSISQNNEFMNIGLVCFKKNLQNDNNIDINEKDFERSKIYISSNLIGEYNAYNIAAVISLIINRNINLNLDKKNIDEVFRKIKVSGRLERVRFNSNDIFIDYAHTEDALENVLKTLKKGNYRKIITIFGCGGDREKEKRPKMGEVAERYSDIIIITNDNPRNEDESLIINMILEGIKDKTKVLVEKDRAKAIEIGIEKLKKLDNSALLVAGKGHESYQEIKNKKIYFSDIDQIKKVINNKKL